MAKYVKICNFCGRSFGNEFSYFRHFEKLCSTDRNEEIRKVDKQDVKHNNFQNNKIDLMRLYESMDKFHERKYTP